MKRFDFGEVDKKLNRKSQKKVKEEEANQNFLQLYEDIPMDPKLQSLCTRTLQLFDETRKNNRYYSYQSSTKPTDSSDTQRQVLVKDIVRLKNYHMPYKQEKRFLTQQQLQALKQQEEGKRKRLLALAQKFRNTIRLMLSRMKRLKVTFHDIIVNDLFSKQPYKFGSELLNAAKEGSQQKVWRILLENKFSLFSVDNSGKNALTWACIRGHHKIIKILLDAGMLPDRTDITGLTPYDYAIKYNHTECIKSLVLHNQSNLLNNLSPTESSPEMRNIINLVIQLRGNMEKLPMEKRQQLLEEQYNYLYG